jgi:DDE superfamily endonuclease
MPDVPMAIMTVLGSFASLFSRRVLAYVNRLLVGAILAPGERTVSAVLRGMGQSTEVHFQNYHRVLNRAQRSSLEAGRRLPGLLLGVFVPAAPVVMGIDETIERRRGERISAQGISRDPVRSWHAHVVKASGLPWVCLMVPARIPWRDRMWALPFLTVLAPSERYYQARGRRLQSLLDRARQRVRLVRRWLPGRELAFVGDSAYAALEWLDAMRESVGVITRLRLDAALSTPAPPRRPKRNGRPRKKGRRLPTLGHLVAAPTTPGKQVAVAPWYGQKARHVHITAATAVWSHSGLPPVPMRWVRTRDPAGRCAPQALLSPRLDLDPVQSRPWFVHRWRLATTVEEARAQLGLATSRPWSDRSVARTTPRWFGLSSLATPIAAHLIRDKHAPVRPAARFPKEQASFSDTIALVRRCPWSAESLSTSGANADVVKIPRSLCDRFTDALCYVA